MPPTCPHCGTELVQGVCREPRCSGYQRLIEIEVLQAGTYNLDDDADYHYISPDSGRIEKHDWMPAQVGEESSTWYCRVCRRVERITYS